MIVTYLRSSSYGCYSSCPQQYFLNYVLGIPDPGNKKAEKGTIVHKVMECLAQGRKVEQDGVGAFEDDAIGIINVYNNVDYSRLHTDGFVNDLCRASFDYYSKKSKHTYDNDDFFEVKEWTWRALKFNNGAYDPRKMEIIEPELHFDLEIKEPWAEYDFVLPTGERIFGNLCIKGTIDLVARASDTVYESFDWKTGSSRKDWVTGVEKDYKEFRKDAQLRMYHYALTRMFPDVKQFIPTIYYIRAGGPFTIAFGPQDIKDTLEMLRVRFEKIKSVTRPQLVKTWKCTKVCHYGMTPHPSGKIDPRTKKPYTICQYMADKVRKVGINTVMIEDTADKHRIDFYRNPGS